MIKNLVSIFVMLSTLFVTIRGEAQINVIANIPSVADSKPYTVVYDSLTNIEKIGDDSIAYKHLIGQTLFYVEPDTTKLDVYHNRLYNTSQIKYTTPHISQSSYSNRYWKLKEVSAWKYGYNPSFEYAFELQDTLAGTIVYSRPNNMNRDFIVLGYYEKMKQLYVGKTFIYKNYYSYDIYDSYNGYRKFNNLINLETKKVGDSIPENSIWKCIDIGAFNVTQHAQSGKNDNRCPVILIFENEELGKYYSYTQDYMGKPFETKVKYIGGYLDLLMHLGKFIDFDQRDLVLNKEKEFKQGLLEKKKKLIAKYGKYWGNLISDGQLAIGMTKQMCRDSWGEPKTINETITQYGKHEQWIYYSVIVYFDNGKITAIQDY